MKHFFIICLFAALAIPNTISGLNNYFFRRISIEQGLSNTGVNCILRDYKGVLWIGTKTGLNSFDRNELKTYYSNDNDDSSLQGNNIYMIAEDAQHNIWVSNEGGLDKYDPVKRTFIPQIKEQVFCALNIEDGILFGGRGVFYKYSYNTNKIEIIHLRFVEKMNNLRHAVNQGYDISEIAVMDKNTILFGTKEDGVFTCNIHDYRLNELIHTDSRTLMSLYLDKEGYIYLSTFRQGLSCYDKNGKLHGRYILNDTEQNNNIILDITEHNGKIWMATDGGGINIFDPSTKKISSIQHTPGDVNSLPVNSITVLYKDYDNNLWAGSVRDGAFLIKESYITSYRDVSLNSVSGVSEKSIISLYEDNEQMLWIGTDGGGINKYDPTTNHFTHYDDTYGDKIVSITDINDRELLVSLYAKGFFIFNKQTRKQKPFYLIDRETTNWQCFSGFVAMCHKIAPDKLLILARDGFIYNTAKQKFSPVKSSTDEPLPLGLQLAYADNYVAFVIKNNCIFGMQDANGVLYPVLQMDENENINSVAFDKNHTLWIGSNKGLSKLDLNSSQLTRIETNLFDRISYLYRDELGRLWVSAANVLFSYTENENKFTIWGESDGFQPNDLFALFNKASKTNNIYLGGINGFVKIDKDISYSDEIEPQLSLQDILLNGESAIGKVNQKKNTIDIPWNYTSLNIKINIKEKDIFRKTLFRFKIRGASTLSDVESYNNTLNLASLSPGSYNIYAACTTKSGYWSSDVQILSICVTPPWYKNTFVVMGMIFLIIIVIICIVTYLLRKKEDKLKWAISRHQQELNEEKIQFLINVSHELRTPLTLIYAPLKRLLDSKKTDGDPEMNQQLTGIYKQAERMKNIINLVLDSDKASSGEKKLNVSTVQLNPWIKSVVDDFSSEFTEKNIITDYSFDDTIGDINLDDAKCRIVLSNLIMNAVKFSPENSNISIHTRKQNGFVRIEIADQGIGLVNVDTSKLFSRFYQGNHGVKGSGIGLAYAKELVELHKGRIGAEENENGGATFYIEFPLDISSSENAFYNNLLAEQNYNNLKMLEYLSPDFDTTPYRIAIVEDNDEFRLFLGSELKSHFANVYEAPDGKTGLEMIHEKLPDIIISDIMMPEMNGYELCRAVKRDIEISHIPVVLLTAISDKENVELGYKLGADFYLSKPFDMVLLLTVVRNLLRNKDIIRQKYTQETYLVTPFEATSSKVDEEFLLRLNNLILENMSNTQFDVKFLTEHMAMSRASLYNKVKALTGLGVNDYINKHRIEKACRLLSNTSLNISEISFETGFASQRYFSTSFKQAVGVTPSKYRENGQLP